MKEARRGYGLSENSPEWLEAVSDLERRARTDLAMLSSAAIRDSRSSFGKPSFCVEKISVSRSSASPDFDLKALMALQY